MSDSCKCPYSGLSIDDLSLLKQQDLKKTLNVVTPVLFKYGEKDKIIQMTALLSSFEDVSEDTLVAVRTTAVPMIRGGLYFWGSTIVESMGKVVSNLEEGKIYWTQELVNSLEKQADLKNIQTWLGRQKSLAKTAEIFQITGTIECLLENAIESDKELEELKFWIENRSKIADLVKTFVCIKKRIKQKAEVRIIIEKERINGMLGLANEESVKTVIDSLRKPVCADVMQECLALAKVLEIPIDINEYKEMADKLLILANKLKGQELRKGIIRFAYYTYKGLEISYGYQFRDQVTAKVTGSGSENWDRAVLKAAAKVVPGLKYQKQGFWDF